MKNLIHKFLVCPFWGHRWFPYSAKSKSGREIQFEICDRCKTKKGFWQQLGGF